MIAAIIDTFATPVVVALMGLGCYAVGRQDGRDAEAQDVIDWAQEQRDRLR